MTAPRMTDPDFHWMLEAYRSFEKRVSELMQGACAPFCSVCKTPCCRVEICREADESPFLQAVQNVPALPKTTFDKKTGYLGCTGCSLKVGRPPICHAFVCSLIITSQPSEMHRYTLECLGDLVTYIGAKVWRKRHLVETVTHEHVMQADIGEFRTRLEKAEAALVVVREFFLNAVSPDEEGMRVLGMIRKF